MPLPQSPRWGRTKDLDPSALVDGATRPWALGSVMASPEAHVALLECLKQSRVDAAMATCLATFGIETLEDFTNCMWRDQYVEDLVALQSRGPEPLRDMAPEKPRALAQAMLRAAYLLPVGLLKRAMGRAHDDLSKDLNAPPPPPQPVRGQLTASWSQHYHLNLPVEL
ncbi:hypothetical protein N9L68_09245 [bacterium]|nr:hypothetical protein [bacterium]